MPSVQLCRLAPRLYLTQQCRLLSSVYSISKHRDFPHDDDPQPGPSTKTKVTLKTAANPAGKRVRFKPLKNMRLNILKYWKPEYITDTLQHARHRADPIPQLVEGIDLNEVIAERQCGHRGSFDDIQDFAEYVQPMLIVEALAQAQQQYAGLVSDESPDLDQLCVRLRLKKVSESNQGHSILFKLHAVGAVSDADFDGLTSRTNKFTFRDCLFSAEGLCFSDEPVPALVNDWQWTNATAQTERLEWGMGDNGASGSGRSLQVHLSVRVFDEEVRALLQEDDCYRPQPGDVVHLNYLADMRLLTRHTTAMLHLNRSPLLLALLNPALHPNVFNEPDPTAAIEPDAHLNASQTQVVQHVCDDIRSHPKRPRVTLVHGPPGTGKSYTLLRLIRQLIDTNPAANRQKHQPIVVCAPSNNAVDNVLLTLMMHNGRADCRTPIRFSRVGRREKVHESLLQHYVDQDGLDPNGSKVRLHEQDVIGVTLDSSVNKCLDALVTRGVQCVLVDEACQATEVEVMLTLRFKSHKLVLFGDPCQLQPTIISQHLLSTTAPVSLFSRCVNQLTGGRSSSFCKQAFLLDTQYRMQEAIARFPCQHVYEGRLHTATPPSNYPLQPFLFVNVEQSAEQQGALNTRSFVNTAEARVLVQLCAAVMRQSATPPQRIGVITFYADQVALIKSLLRQAALGQPGARGLDQIEVNTVDGFQGREKSVVVLSCVRSARLGFVSDMKRMNVAITRAKCGLYVVGNKRALKAGCGGYLACFGH